MRLIVGAAILFCSIVFPRFSGAVIFVPSEKPQPVILEEEIHKGDIAVEGNTVLLVTNKKLIVEGNVYGKDSARIILDNAILEIRSYPEPRMVFSGSAHLEAQDSIIRVFGPILAEDNVSIDLERVVLVNVIELQGTAKITVRDSWLFEDRFGGVAVKDRSQVSITNSVVGGITLDFSNIQGARVSNLHPGVLETWSSDTVIPGNQRWSVVLSNVEVKENTGFKGNYELGWGLAVDANSNFFVSASVLNRFSVRFKREDAILENLDTRRVYSGSWHGVQLQKVVVQGEWSFLLQDSLFTIRDSDGVGIIAAGAKDLSVIRSEIVRFVAKGFGGKVAFEDSMLRGPLWVQERSNIAVDGSFAIEELDPRFDETSRMVRNLPVVFRRGSDAVPNVEGRIEYRNTILTKQKSNNEGILVFPIIFDETKNSYRESRGLKVSDQSFAYEGLVSIFTSSPVVVDLGPQVNLESFSFGLDEDGFFIEAFIVNQGFEPARTIEAKLENSRWKVISPHVLLFEKLDIGQKEPVMWRTEFPSRGTHSVEIRIDGSNFPAILKTYTFERGRHSVYPVILSEEYFEEEENQFTFWACDEVGCREGNDSAQLEERGGDRAVRLEGRSFALLNTVFHEDSITFDMLLERGSVNINFRSQPVGKDLERYFVTLSKNTVALSKQQGGNFTVLAREAAEFSLDEWHLITILHKDKKIEILIGEEAVFGYTDDDFLPEGVVSIEALDDSTVWFDDVVLKGRKSMAEETSPLVSWFIIFLIPVAALFLGSFAIRKFGILVKK
jgi:hypothetical protein